MSKQVAAVGRGPFDRIIIESFASNMSAEEVAAETGNILSPAQCLNRLTQLVRAKDVLESKDRLALLLEDAYWLRAKLRKQMEESSYIDEKQATTWLKTLGVIVDRVEAANLGLGEAMLKFNELRAQEFFESLTGIIDKLLGILAEKHPEIEAEEVNMIVLEAIPAAIPEVK